MKKIVNFIGQVLYYQTHQMFNFSSIVSFKVRKVSTFIVLLVLSLTLYAQDKKTTKIYGEKKEEKTEQSTYYKHIQGSYIFIYNKNNILLTDTYSSFFERLRYSAPAYSLSNRPVLDSYVKKWLVPHFKGLSSSNDKLYIVEVTLFSDIDGNLKEISISFPLDWKLPLRAYESLEKNILASNVKVIFDKNKEPFKGSAWIDYPLRYTLASLKQMDSE